MKSKEQVVFDFIVRFKRRHDGNSPSLPEIMGACNMLSKGHAAYYLDKLVRGGKIKKLKGHRMIEVVGSKWKAPRKRNLF